MARTAAARNLATEDIEVPPPAPSPEMDAAREAAANASLPDDVIGALQAAGERNKAAQSASRKANGTATSKPDAKPAKPKTAKAAAPKPRATIERVPAVDVIALLAQVGISRLQLAAAMKISPSLVTEWVGKGRGNLLTKVPLGRRPEDREGVREGPQVN